MSIGIRIDKRGSLSFPAHCHFPQLSHSFLTNLLLHNEVVYFLPRHKVPQLLQDLASLVVDGAQGLQGVGSWLHVRFVSKVKFGSVVKGNEGSQGGQVLGDVVRV